MHPNYQCRMFLSVYLWHSCKYHLGPENFFLLNLSLQNKSLLFMIQLEIVLQTLLQYSMIWMYDSFCNEYQCKEFTLFCAVIWIFLDRSFHIKIIQHSQLLFERLFFCLTHWKEFFIINIYSFSQLLKNFWPV